MQIYGDTAWRDVGDQEIARLSGAHHQQLP